MRSAAWSWAACAAMLSATGATSAQVIDLAKITPGCGDTPFKLEAGACVADQTKLDALKTPEKCSGQGILWNATSKKCEALPDKSKLPVPNCGDLLPDLAVKDGKCVVDRKVPRSSQGVFKGDCFEVFATTKDNPYQLAAGQRYEVESQRDEGSDKILGVVEARRIGWGPSYFCSVSGNTVREVPASEFEKIGAERLGWTYGMLTLPFKYYPGDKALKGSGALGPYVGRRSGAAGSAITFAATAAVGAVNGNETTDADGKVTTPSLFAVSLALGWMYDISKTPGGKPFKIGLFVGKDFVGASDAAKYPHNRKTWVAFQIGFDFTDN